MSGQGRRTRSRVTLPSAGTALILLDLISDFRFPDGARLLEATLPIARRVRKLKTQARRAGVPSIYVNDDPTRWRSNRADLLARALGTGSRGRPVVECVMPDDGDLFMFKPRHSGFFATGLHALLNELHIRRLVLVGTTSHQCVLFTAMDAYVRDFDVVVPRDCIAAASAVDTTHALHIMNVSLHARLPRGSELRFTKRASAR
jgi:nicotinamidase-related amidase